MDEIMKSKIGQNQFIVPRTVGRSQSDFVAGIRKGEDYGEQLELFRDILKPQARLQVYAMMSLADPKRLDKRIEARIADIARAMGYQPTASGQIAGQVFRDIEDVGIKLRRKEIALFYRKPAGQYSDGRRKYKTGIMNLSILQSFGFYYEDEEGKPIDLEGMAEKELIKYEAVDGGPPLYAIPMIDENGKPMMNKDDKSVRRKRANGVLWRFNSELAEMAMHKETAWIMFADALKILVKYVSQPSAFNLIEKTLFWKGNSLIEVGHEKLVNHLGIASKDQGQVERAIDAAFKAAYDEGIIETPVIIRPLGYYKPTEKTGKERRKGMCYQWRPAKRWRIGKDLPSIQTAGENDEKMECQNDGKMDGLKA